MTTVWRSKYRLFVLLQYILQTGLTHFQQLKISYYSSLEPQGYHVAKVLRSAIAASGFLVIVAIKRLGDKISRWWFQRPMQVASDLAFEIEKSDVENIRYIHIYIHIIHDLLSMCQLLNLPPVFFFWSIFSPWKLKFFQDNKKVCAPRQAAPAEGVSLDGWEIFHCYAAVSWFTRGLHPRNLT